MKYFKRDLLESLNGRGRLTPEEADKQWSESLRMYRSYIDSIFTDLPHSVQVYRSCQENDSFHDTSVTKVEHDRRERKVRIDMYERCSLVFSGVGHVEMTDLEVSLDEPVAWLYDEIELVPGGHLVEFRILFDEGELSLQATSVRIHEWNY